MITINRKNPTAGEVTSSLTNAEDGGLHFDGTGQVTATALTLPAPYSFEVILKTGDDVTTGQILIGNASSSSARRALELNSGEIRFSYYNGSSWASVSGGSISANTIYHIVATRDSSDVQKIYINGLNVTTGTNAVSTFGTSGLSLGYSSNSSFPHRLKGTLSRARIFNRVLSGSEIKEKFENKNLEFSEMYGSQTAKISGVNANWGTAQADTGNDATDKATFDSNYAWKMAGSPTDISVASNTLTFSTAGASHGIYYAGQLTAGKTYRLTVNVGSVTGGANYKVQYYTGSAYADVHTLASGVNTVEFTPSANNGTLYILSTSGTSGTLALNAASTANSLVQSGCVSDYDLAFANPTQSLMVQDRAGAADGTSSASGVVQTQPIVQLNSKAISVSAATVRNPGDGAIVADKAGIGTGSPGRLLELFNATNPALRINNGNSTADIGVASSAGALLTGAADDDLVIVRNGPYGIAIGTNGQTRMAISSTGATTITKASAGTALLLDSGGTNTYLGIKESGGTFNYIANDGGDMLFQTPGSSYSTKLKINSAGYSLFGCTSVPSATVAGLGIHGSSSANASSSGSSTTAYNHWIFLNGNGQVGSIQTSASATAYNTSSDYRLKENLTPLTGALDRIEQLPVYRFNFKADSEKTVDGFVAHEAQAIVPESVTGEKDAMKTVVVKEAVEAIEYQAAIEAVEYQPAIEAVEYQAATYYEEGDELPEGVQVGDIKTEEIEAVEGQPEIQAVEGQPEIEAVEAQEEVTEEQPEYQGIDQSKLVPLLVAAVKELKAEIDALKNA